MVEHFLTALIPLSIKIILWQRLALKQRAIAYTVHDGEGSFPNYHLVHISKIVLA
jgi:hypothetical protein